MFKKVLLLSYLINLSLGVYLDAPKIVQDKREMAVKCFTGEFGTTPRPSSEFGAISDDGLKLLASKYLNDAVILSNDYMLLLDIASQAHVYKFPENAQKALNKSLEISRNEEQALSAIFDKAFELGFFSMSESILKVRCEHVKSISFAEKSYNDAKRMLKRSVAIRALNIWFRFLKADENAKKEDFTSLSEKAAQLDADMLLEAIYSHINRM